MLGIVGREHRQPTCFVVLTMRVNHGEQLPKHSGAHPWGQAYIQIQFYPCTTLVGMRRRTGKGEGKQKKTQGLNINPIKPDCSHIGQLSLQRVF